MKLFCKKEVSCGLPTSPQNPTTCTFKRGETYEARFDRESQKFMVKYGFLAPIIEVDFIVSHLFEYFDILESDEINSVQAISSIETEISRLEIATQITAALVMGKTINYGPIPGDSICRTALSMANTLIELNKKEY